MTTEGCEPVPCPPFEEEWLEVTGSAPVGHRVVEGFQVADHETENPNTCAVCMGALAEIVEAVRANALAGHSEPDPVPTAPEEGTSRTIQIHGSMLPEGIRAMLSGKTRHPECVITNEHASHRIMGARVAGWECGGKARPPKPAE